MTDGTALDDDFERAWELAEPVGGWMTREQARLLWDAASRLRPGAVVLEIGSHQGRSTLVLGSAARRVGATVVAVDPFVEGRLFGGAPTRALFEANVARAGLQDVVELVPDYSTRRRPTWDRPIDLLYVDGKHDYWTCSDDLRWASHLPPGGQVLVHDSFSSIGVTSSLLVHVGIRGRLRYLDRSTSLALLDTRPPTPRDRLRLAAQLPWFVRNVVIKVLLRLRLRPVARALGHEGTADPY
jgi:predicted O-methyltransferase YrrM